MGSYVSHHCGLASSVGGVARGSAQLACRSHGMPTRRASLSHRELAARPGAGMLDGLAGTAVMGLHYLE
jgi:hypothetical protein